MQPDSLRVEGVSRVVDYIRRIISQNKILPGIRVRGEVSGLCRQPSGRVYFDLKENADILRCVAWANDAANLPSFNDGDEIIAGGEFGTYAPRSQYQLFVKNIELTGIGALYAEFEKLKEKFRKEGLFEESRKRPMPAFPRRIALVAAPGKGAEDFMTTISRRAPHIVVELVETRVQGDGAQIEIGEAIDKASTLEVDAIVVTRGGGSYEDLFPFNLEPVVRAIVRAKRPVLSAIGHTGDRHLSDLVADYACETPSNAAQYFGEIRDRFASLIERARARIENAVVSTLAKRAQAFDYAASGLTRAVRDYLAGSERRLTRLDSRINAQTPQRRLTQRQKRVTAALSRFASVRQHVLSRPQDRLLDFERRLQRVQPFALEGARRRLVSPKATLVALDPHAALGRGYAIVRFDGRAVRDAAAVPDGAQIEAQVLRGKLLARVERKIIDG